MKASDFRNLVTVAVICVGALAYGSVRYLHHRQWNASYLAAQHAFAQAWVARDDPETFGPLKRRAEDALARAQAIEPWGKTDSIRAVRLGSCVTDLDIYFREAALYRTRRDEGGSADAEWKEWSQTSADLHSCLSAVVR